MEKDKVLIGFVKVAPNVDKIVFVLEDEVDFRNFKEQIKNNLDYYASTTVKFTIRTKKWVSNLEDYN